jgi:hypothetical protein
MSEKLDKSTDCVPQTRILQAKLYLKKLALKMCLKGQETEAENSDKS